MKTLGFISATLFILSTSAQPVWAAEDEGDFILNPKVNALLGAGQIGPEGRTNPGGAAGGLTVDLGAGPTVLEAGTLLLRTGNGREATFGLPLFVKFNLLSYDRGALFGKAGATTAFESGGYDVLLGAGLGARVRLTPTLDWVIDGTFNHGVLDQSPAAGTNPVSGVLLLTGLRFRI